MSETVWERYELAQIAVGGFSRLHPADIVAHDEEDVGLLLLLCGRRRARRRHGNERREQAEAEPLGHSWPVSSVLAAQTEPTAGARLQSNEASARQGGVALRLEAQIGHAGLVGV